jgi:hypothetical protein
LLLLCDSSAVAAFRPDDRSGDSKIGRNGERIAGAQRTIV